jgi:hypothetical protein
MRLLDLVWPFVTSSRHGCRAEAVWTKPCGPPYALAQGTLRNKGRQANVKMLLTSIPREGAPAVQRGDVSLIREGLDSIMALAAPLEWGSEHNVWGHVDNMKLQSMLHEHCQ